AEDEERDDAHWGLRSSTRTPRGRAMGMSLTCALLCPDRGRANALVRVVGPEPRTLCRMERIRGDDLEAIGLAQGPAVGVALNALPRATKRLGREAALAELAVVVAAPEQHTGHAYFAKVAEKLLAERAQAEIAFVERAEPAPFQSWCSDAEDGALSQMD